MLGKAAHQEDRAGAVIERERHHRTEWIAAQSLRNGRERAVTMRAQIAARGARIAHSLIVTAARRLPSAMQSLRSSSVSARSLAAPATWLAPYGVPPLVVDVSSASE